MKIDFSKKFTNFNGEVLKDATSGLELSLGEVCIESLMAVDKDNVIDASEKIRRYNLASEIYKNKDNLSAEEIVLLKELIGKYYAPIIVGQAFPILDGD